MVTLGFDRKLVKVLNNFEKREINFIDYCFFNGAFKMAVLIND